jgi:hypothetical protein
MICWNWWSSPDVQGPEVVAVRRLSMVVLAVLGLALAGCGGSAGSSASGSASPPGQSASPSPSGTAGPSPTAPPATGPLVQYGRQGGLAGVDDRLFVQPDGAYQITRRGGVTKTGTLPAAELAHLRAVLEGSHFRDIPAVNPAPTEMRDGYTYHVVYAGHEVVAADGALPDALRDVLGELNTLMERHASG